MRVKQGTLNQYQFFSFIFILAIGERERKTDHFSYKIELENKATAINNCATSRKLLLFH